MELVLYPEDIEKPDDGPWVKRLEYVTVDELIDDYEISNAAIGRTHCPVLDYMRAHRTDPLEQVEDKIYDHPQWGPIALAETMWKTLFFNSAATHPHGEFLAAWVQHYCARRLVKHDWSNARYAVSEMLKEPSMMFKSPEAKALIMDYFVSHHPNPDLFFAKYPAPDSEEKAA